jgi:hypothetical protein
MSVNLSGPAVEPVPQISDWTQRLGAISKQPLALCPDFPRIAQRWEAWWQGQSLDRPIFIGSANTNPARPITRRLDLLHQPEQWFEAKLADMKQQARAGEALPHIRVDFGPVLIGSLLGGRTEIGADTTWTHTMIQDDWSNAPHALQRDHPWWKLLGDLLDRVAADAAGRYLVCTPDLGGSADVLLNLRGSSELCLDVVEKPDVVRRAVEAIYPAWRTTWIELYRRTVERGAGVIHWLLMWSNQPYMIPACDFNFMIGPPEFELLLSDIARQSATAQRAVFHLDGPGAARHVEALLEVPHIRAIQFTPGEGTPSALAWLDMFKLIQSRGRSVYVFCPAHEVLELSKQLKPGGLAIHVTGIQSPQHLSSLYDDLKRSFA